MTSVSFDSPAVQSYLSILQNVIGRMAANSAACKTWCVGLVSAVLVVTADKGNRDLVWICAIPILLMAFLDSYYLGMEQRFRQSYNEFVRKVHAQDATIEDVFIVSPGSKPGLTLDSTTRAFASISVWPFYALLALTLLMVRNLLEPPAA